MGEDQRGRVFDLLFSFTCLNQSLSAPSSSAMVENIALCEDNKRTEDKKNRRKINNPRSLHHSHLISSQQHTAAVWQVTKGKTGICQGLTQLFEYAIFEGV